MRLRLRAAFMLLFLVLAALGFGQINITAATASPTTLNALTPGSFATVQLAPGPNTISIDIAGTYTGQFAVYAAYQGKGGPLRQIPSGNLVNFLTAGSTGISANTAGAWTVTISGPGYATLVATSLASGTPAVMFTAGVGGALPAGSGGVSSSVNITGPNPLPVSASSLPLPTGASTSANQASILAALQATLAISAVALPLPTGAATQATLASLLSAVQGTLMVTETDQNTTGTITANGQSVTTAKFVAGSTVNVGLSGTFSVGTTVQFEASPDNVNWVAVTLRKNGTTTWGGSASGGATWIGTGSIAGLEYFRVRCSAFTALDSVAVTINVTPAPGVFQIANGRINPQDGGNDVSSTNPLHVAVGDGTTTANAVAGDSGQNGFVTVPGRKEVPFTTTTAQAVATTDVSNYRFVSIHLTSQGTSATLTFQISNDNTNWVSISVSQPGVNTGSFTSTSTAAANTMWEAPLNARYFRINVTGISAGTTAGTCEFFATGISHFTQGSGATVQPIAGTTGGASIYRNISLVATGVSIKGSAGSVYGFTITNNSNAARFVKLYNKASAPTVGTDTPVITIQIGPGATVTQSFTVPLAFATGIGIGGTNLVGDSDATAPSSNDLVVNLYFS